MSGLRKNREGLDGCSDMSDCENSNDDYGTRARARSNALEKTVGTDYEPLGKSQGEFGLLRSTDILGDVETPCIDTNQNNMTHQKQKLPVLTRLKEEVNSNDEYHCATDDEVESTSFIKISEFDLFKIETDDELEDSSAVESGSMTPADENNATEESSVSSEKVVPNLTSNDSITENELGDSENNAPACKHLVVENSSQRHLTSDTNNQSAPKERKKYRRCTICELYKSHDFFSKNQLSGRGNSRCKGCIKAIQYTNSLAQGKMKELREYCLHTVQQYREDNLRLEDKLISKLNECKVHKAMNQKFIQALDEKEIRIQELTGSLTEYQQKEAEYHACISKHIESISNENKKFKAQAEALGVSAKEKDNEIASLKRILEEVKSANDDLKQENKQLTSQLL
jgi:Pyruvate/2-oxoacid:ferredoxin oxidoreductase delta subunit